MNELLQVIQKYFQKYLDKGKLLIRKFKRLKIQKMHLDYVAGLLSIPVLITAIIINYGNLTRNNTTAPKATPSPQVIVIPATQAPQPQTGLPTSTPQACIKSVGPITISYPQEGQTLSDNPVCITINYPNNNYCPVVWSYRMGQGSWSDFNNNAPCLYNLPSGNNQFQLKVDSTVSSDTQTLVRNFIYSGSNNALTPTPTLTITPTPTMTLTPTPTLTASSSATLK